jgi:hypothetical protein
MTPINYTAEFIQAEASAFARSRDICLVSISLCELALL